MAGGHFFQASLRCLARSAWHDLDRTIFLPFRAQRLRQGQDARITLYEGSKPLSQGRLVDHAENRVDFFLKNTKQLVPNFDISG